MKLLLNLWSSRHHRVMLLTSSNTKKSSTGPSFLYPHYQSDTNHLINSRPLLRIRFVATI